MPEIEGAETLVPTAAEEAPPSVTEEPHDPGQPEVAEPATEGTPAEPDPADELDEWEHVDGKKYQVPKALKPHLMKDADYTQKTQKLAEERKALETARLQHAQLSEERVDAIAEVKNAQRQLAACDKKLQEAHAAGDYVAVQDAMVLQNQWRQYLDQTTQRFHQIDQQAAEQAQQVAAKRAQEAVAELDRDIPGWSTGIGAKVAEFAIKEIGLTPEELASMADPRIGKLLHRAMVGSQLMKTAAKPAPVPTVEKPLAQVTQRSGSPAARKSLAEMEMDEYVKARRAGRRA